jgi:tetratricopeptide (TPR) repeat protein
MAIETTQQLNQHDPDDLVVRLSLAELLNDRYPDAPQIQQRVIELAEGVHNASPIHAALMFYRARALRKLGMYEGADDTLKKATRRKKDYPKDLLLALTYERAMIYEATGKTKEAQKEFQKVFAEAPTYEDVAAKLGL